MKITVRQLQAIDAADLDFASICLVAAPNEGGKSTIARYAGMLLSGATMPPDLPVAKKDAAILVHKRGEHGGIAIHTGSGHLALTYPAVDKRGEGVPPQASAVAVGLAHFSRMSPSERASALAGYIKAAPVWRDFVDAMKANGITDPSPPAEEDGQPVPGVVERCWKALEAQGWDVTHKNWLDHAAQKKGAWAEVTGEGWGAKKAVGWLPKTWDMELGELKREALVAAVDRAAAAVDAALKNEGAAGERNRASAEKIASRDAIAAQLDKSTADLAKADTDLETQRQLRASLPEAEAGDLVCPHCDKPVRMEMVGGKLVKAAGKAMSAAEVKKARAAIATADGTISRLTAEKMRLSGEIARLEETVAEIDALAGEGDAVVADPAALPAARAALTLATARLATFDQKATAARLHTQIARALLIADVLGPAGLRKTVMLRALDMFNEGPLTELCEAAGYAAVSIAPDEDLTLSLGRYPYALLSRAAQYRVDAILQIACARLDGAALVILDGADVLDQPGREGLIGALLAAQVPALVCMTYDEPRHVPDLHAAGVGESYWLADGRSVPLADAKAAAAVAA